MGFGKSEAQFIFGEREPERCVVRPLLDGRTAALDRLRV